MVLIGLPIKNKNDNRWRDNRTKLNLNLILRNLTIFLKYVYNLHLNHVSIIFKYI